MQLSVDGLEVTQSSAILRYVGKITGFYPADSLLALQVDEIDMIVEEVAMRTIIATAHLTGQARLDARAALAADKKGVLHFWLGQLNSKLSTSSSGFAVGEALTVADLRIFCELTAATSGW